MLEGLEPVRKRPGMYIGSTGSRGLHHLVYEVLDNAVDEVQGSHARLVRVQLSLGDGWVEVEDDGRGIPTDTHPRRARARAGGRGGALFRTEHMPPPPVPPPLSRLPRACAPHSPLSPSS